MDKTTPNFEELAREAFPGVNEDTLARIAAIGERGYTYGLAGWYKDLDFGSDADYCYGIGAEIKRFEDALDIDDGAVHDFFVDQHGEGLLVHERDCADPACCHDDDDGDDDDAPRCAHDGCESRESLPSPRGNTIRYCRAHVPRYFDCQCGETFVCTLETSGGFCDDCRA